MGRRQRGTCPVDPQRLPRPACSNGLDDDGDGRVDFPADTGCEAVNDDAERGGSFAVGVSEPLYFSTPLVADVQGRTAQSPLLDQRITLVGRADVTAPAEGDRVHRLVVTQTDNSGFYVTDIDDRSCGAEHCFNSLYSFNFRTPDGMRPCDLLTSLTGSVAEFVSSTQLAQPGFQVGVEWHPDDTAVGACLIPEADVITPALARDAALLERYESGLVRVENVRLPDAHGPCPRAPGAHHGGGHQLRPQQRRAHHVRRQRRGQLRQRLPRRPDLLGVERLGALRADHCHARHGSR
ncbi:MAG: hypothetical protein V9E96_10540 [Chitinophagaceae bacterium]